MIDEKRRTFRCPANREVLAVLKWGRKQREVRLLDQSAEGFSVSLRGRIDLQVGHRLQLLTESGCSEAQVANVQYQGGLMRIGLYRLRDLPDDAGLYVAGPFSWWHAGVPLGRGALGAFLIVMLWVTTLCWLVLFAKAWLTHGSAQFPWPW